MSVITTADVQTRPENGYDDPNLPIATWQCSQRSVGDATGGFNGVQINLAAAAVQPGNVFSLEQIMVENETDSGAAPVVSLAGMEVATPGLEVRRFVLPVVLGDTETTLFSSLENLNPRLFLGRKAGSGPAGTMTILIDNTDGADLVIAVMGYMWTPRSMVQGNGGFRRPAAGMFPQ